MWRGTEEVGYRKFFFFSIYEPYSSVHVYVCKNKMNKVVKRCERESDTRFLAAGFFYESVSFGQMQM